MSVSVRDGTSKPQYTCIRKAWRQVSWGVSKNSLHERVWRARGKASNHTCPCGAPAAHWANRTGAYNDIFDYEAMCVRCHRQYDEARAKAFPVNLRMAEIINGREDVKVLDLILMLGDLDQDLDVMVDVGGGSLRDVASVITLINGDALALIVPSE